MTAFSYPLNHFILPEWGYGFHNIFLSMFLVGVVISTIEIFQKDRKKGAILLGLIFVAQLLWFYMPKTIPLFRSMNGDEITGIFPNIYLNEFGFEFVVLGVLMYFLKEKKDLFCVMYIVFCIAQFSNELVWGERAFPTQWIMIGALPLMMRYNNKKGPGLKYFFYVFYPAHTFLLFYIANFVLK